MMRVAALILVALAGACSSEPNEPEGEGQSLQCVQNASCSAVPDGRCMPATTGERYCAYPDTTCPSGYRYSNMQVAARFLGVCAPAPGTGGPGPGDDPPEGW